MLSFVKRCIGEWWGSRSTGGASEADAVNAASVEKNGVEVIFENFRRDIERYYIGRAVELVRGPFITYAHDLEIFKEYVKNGYTVDSIRVDGKDLIIDGEISDIYSIFDFVVEPGHCRICMSEGIVIVGTPARKGIDINCIKEDDKSS